MISKKKILFPVAIILLSLCIFSFSKLKSDNENFVTYTVDLKKQNLKLYWRDDKKELFRSLGNLKQWLAKNNEKLLFAMNAGMYQTDNSPLGLYIQDKKVISEINKRSGNGNFYLKPNGILFTTVDNVAGISRTEDFANNNKIKYATQSGPMLISNKELNPAFAPSSKNLNIRNGVGILPNGNLVFAMSKQEINFYDFAKHFKDVGCINALYLDGFVSRTYLPERNWKQEDGNFGVIVGVSQKSSR